MLLCDATCFSRMVCACVGHKSDVDNTNIIFYVSLLHPHSQQKLRLPITTPRCISFTTKHPGMTFAPWGYERSKRTPYKCSCESVHCLHCFFELIQRHLCRVCATSLLLEYTLGTAATARGFTSYAGVLLNNDASLLRVPFFGDQPALSTLQVCALATA